MTNLPHVIAGTPLPLSEEHVRVYKAYCREHNLPMAARLMRADVMNAAVDWWNALGTETGEEEGT